MALTGEKDVADMARQISQVTKRDGWKSDKGVGADMRNLLGKLTSLQVDKELLQRTKIGAAVNKLKKHEDPIVSGYSQSLTNRWKNAVGLASKSSSSSRPPERHRVPSPSPPKKASGDQKRLENARKKLQEGYASERAKRDSRTVQSAADIENAAETSCYFSSQHVDDFNEVNCRRYRPGSRPSSASSRGSSAARELPPAVDARKAMLDKMYPRVCGVGANSTASSSSGSKKKPSAASRRKEANLSEGQREVISWLKGLSVDMSEYASSFFDNGFDSMELLSKIEKSDLPGLVPKKGHHRLIQQALDDLRHKHSTSASSQRRDRFQKSSRMRRRDPFEDEDSDDSFVVSDDGEYRLGHITAMFRKNRKRAYSYDSDESINMEASYDEIQKEEKHSTLIEHAEKKKKNTFKSYY
eukprot:jgi/Phyca11/13253/fgenesh1_pg.PHYCAscaffold_3_\